MKLQTYLTENYLTQEAFASMVGVSQPAVARWATGIRRPSWDHVEKIVEVTDGDVTPEDFFRKTLP